MKEFRNPADVHAPVAAYTHQIELSGPQRLLVLSGQVGRTADGALPEDPYEQLGVALDNLARNLRAAGMDVRDVVKITYYLVGELEPAKRAAVIAAHFGDNKPCSTLLYVAGLAGPAFKVEIDAWASRDL